MILRFILIGLLLTSCTPLNGYEKKALSLHAALQVGDYLTTKEILSDGGRELNPIYGKNPSDEKLIAGKAGTWLVIYGVTKCLPSHEHRKVFLNTANSVVGGVVLWNFSWF